MPASRSYKFESRIRRERLEAERTALYRDTRNDAPRCPWIYRGFEEPPNFPRSSGGSIDAGELERCLRSIDTRHLAERAVARDA
jgi:hypothetical protein